MNLSVLQTNLGRGRAAMGLVEQQAGEAGRDLIVVTEPNVKRASSGGWWMDLRKDVAVKLSNNRIKVTERGKSNGFAWIKSE